MILVFGETGQIANELRAFAEVRTLSREQADLSNPIECRNAIFLHKPEAVINAAAFTNVDDAEGNETFARLINGEAPAVIANACHDLKIPFIHISTDYVFDGSGANHWSSFDVPEPINAYGRSKLQGEQAIKASGCTYVILRTSWVISAHGNNFVKTMLQLSKTKNQLPIVDDQVGGPTFARDIARACITIAYQLIKDPDKLGIYHYSGQPDVSWCQFATEIFERTGRRTVAVPIPTKNYPTTAARPHNSRLNCSTTEAMFGITQPLWRDGLDDILIELGEIHDAT